MSKFWSLWVLISSFTNKGIHCLLPRLYSWGYTLFTCSPNQTTLFPEGDSFSYLGVYLFLVPLKCTRWTPFSSTTLRVQPLSRCFLNLGGTPFSESSHFQVANGLWFWAWLPTLFSFSVIQDIFIPQFPSIFGATFPLRCSPSLVSVPISSSLLWRVRIFVQHGTFLSAPAAFFSEHTFQSHASWILLSLQGRIPLLKGYLHIVFHRPVFYLSANRISSLLACPIPKHFSGFCLSPELFCLCSGYTDFPCAGGGLKSRSASAPRAGFKVETISLVNHRTLNPPGGLLHRRPKILFGCILFSPLLLSPCAGNQKQTKLSDFSSTASNL